jgi:hypothetical protein
MNAASNNAGMELPPPIIEQAPQPEVQVETGQTSIEQHPATNLEQAKSAAFSAHAILPMSIPLPGSTPISTDDTSQADDFQIAGVRLPQDKDLIEKEWVNKAKAIVNKNRDDPYKQSEGLTVLRADYMKKQFNKTIKLNK